MKIIRRLSNNKTFADSKKVMYWLCGVPLAVALLVLFILLLEPGHSYIPRSLASKAMALAVADKGQCEEWGKSGQTHFQAKEKDNWYVKYIDYLIGNDFLPVKKEIVASSYAESNLTYRDAAYFGRRAGYGQEELLAQMEKKADRSIPKEEWWDFYGQVLSGAQLTGVEEKDVLIYGTPANMENSERWSAYTSAGTLGFEGLALDGYLDRNIKVLMKGQEIITVVQLVSDEVVYRNVWLTVDEKQKLGVFVGGITREFALPSSEGGGEDFQNQVADITLKKGKLQLIQLKKTTITGKVLSVKTDSIEVEGYGPLPLSEDFKVYKTYGPIKEQKRKDILVGYDLQRFVVSEGKICAALTTAPFDAQNIRVLIMDTGFAKLYHKEISLSFDGPVALRYGEQEEILEAGQSLTLTSEDARFGEGRISLVPQSPETQIEVTNIQRGQGTPRYPGTMEIYREDNALFLINEVDLEKYLERVVPSEMPASYEKEALKAQAVCARTYAYKQIKANAYSQYGAHVDDSTGFQVYNNIETSDNTKAAVNETYGELLLLNDEPVDTYYFSTSCGFTTDGTVWGAKAEDYPYLKGVSLRDDRKEMDFSVEGTFEAFIKSTDFHAYDSEFPLYRWKTTLTSRQLDEKIGGIGTITDITMVERGTGGIGKKLKITGTEGERMLTSQTEIRNTLGNKALTYTNRNDKTFTGWDSLPSAFIAVEKVKTDEESQVTTFAIYGGGYGHGVGMSQNGAQGMAKEGKSYRDILQFFYTGVEVE